MSGCRFVIEVVLSITAIVLVHFIEAFSQLFPKRLLRKSLNSVRLKGVDQMQIIGAGNLNIFIF